MADRFHGEISIFKVFSQNVTAVIECYSHIHVYSPRAEADEPFGANLIFRTITIRSISTKPASFSLPLTFQMHGLPKLNVP